MGKYGCPLHPTRKNGKVIEVGGEFVVAKRGGGIGIYWYVRLMVGTIMLRLLLQACWHAALHVLNPVVDALCYQILNLDEQGMQPKWWFRHRWILQAVDSFDLPKGWYSQSWKWSWLIDCCHVGSVRWFQLNYAFNVILMVNIIYGKHYYPCLNAEVVVPGHRAGTWTEWIHQLLRWQEGCTTCIIISISQSY